jgi:hypothetical protein
MKRDIRSPNLARQTDGAIALVGVRRSPGYVLVFGSA